MRPTVLLFDIDGTLLPTLGIGRVAMERAFEDVVHQRAALAGVSFAGMTDRPIVRAGLANLGLRPSTAEAGLLVERILARYVIHLDAGVRAAQPLPLLPGVLSVLDAVAQWDTTAVGLGTGNIRAGAEAKMRGAGLWQRFAFGGFACDHDDRGELLRIAAGRGAACLRLSVTDCRVVVIGDTPRDVAAATAIGAVSVAVATSHYPVDALAATGATHVFADMTAPRFLPALQGRA